VAEEPNQPEVKVLEKPAESKPAAAASEAPLDEMPGADVEESYDESDEPDLFRPQAQRRRLTVAEEPSAEAGRKPAGEAKAGAKPRLPIFKIGGRLEEKSEPAAQDDAAHARRRARIESFIDGFVNLRDGVERKLPVTLPRKQVIALCGVGLAFLVFLAAGIGVLFKMTGSNVKEAPGTAVSIVASLPDLYVD
jgi:hypothetical protein